MKNRTDLLNFLIEKHGLKSYLEVGLQDSTQNFDKIQCEYKMSVDPDPNAEAKYQMTSDMFFDVWTANINHKFFDIVFIDGLHTAEQVKKDFENALQILSPNGFIVLHDCNPLKEEHTIVPRETERGHWNGDVYKFAGKMSVHDCWWTVDIDNGMGIWQNGIEPYDYLEGYPVFWPYFDKNRKELLNLVSWDEFVDSHL